MKPLLLIEEIGAMTADAAGPFSVCVVGLGRVTAYCSFGRWDWCTASKYPALALGPEVLAMYL
jgi:hypothetical protein